MNDPLVQVAGTALPFIPIATGIITFIIDKTKKEPTLAMSVALVSQGAYLEIFRRFFEEYPQIKAKLTNTLPSEQISKEIHRLGVGEELELDESELLFG